MVGSLGAEPLAAVSLSVSIFILFLVVGMGLSYALPPLVAQADGEGNHRRISQLFKHSLVLNLGYGLLCALLMEFGADILHHLGQEPVVVELAKPYLRISGWTMIPIMLFLSLRAYADGMGETKPAMYATLLGNVFNVLFNYMFIFGKWGAPEMGVAGAALATLLARLIMCITLFLIILRWKDLWQHLRDARYSIYQSVFFKRLLNLGVPTSMQMFFEVSAFAGAALIMGTIGATEQAAHQIAINMAATTFITCMGIGMAATIRVGNQLGKNSPEGVYRAGMSAMIQVSLIMLFFAVLFVIFRHWIPLMYIDDPEVISIATVLLLMAAVFQVSDGLQMVALGALRGLQDVNIPTVITFIAYWIFGIPISYLAANHFDWGPVGVWVGLVVGLTISASLLAYRFHKKTYVPH